MFITTAGMPNLAFDEPEHCRQLLLLPVDAFASFLTFDAAKSEGW